MDAEDLIKRTAGCGVFQIILVFCFFSVRCFHSWSAIFMSFGFYNPGWVCSNQTSTPNVTNSTVHRVALSEEIQDHCWEDNCSTLRSCAKIVFDPETSTLVTEWELICDNTWILSLVLSVQQAGKLAGGILAGQLADWKGRKIFSELTVAFGVLAQLMAAFSNSWQMFCVSRFFIGLFTGGIVCVTFPYAQEFAVSRWRAIWIAIPEWNISMALFALAAWLTKDWVYLHFATAILGFFSFLVLFWVPESPRWLSVKGKVKDANQVIQRMCKINGRPNPNTDLVQQIADKETTRNKEKSSYTYLHLFHRNLWKITVAIVPLFFMLSISYYAISFGIKALSGNLYLNMFCIGIVPIPSMFILPVMANKLGRRVAMMIYLSAACAMAFALVLVYFFTPEGINGSIITILAILTSMCLDTAWMAGIVLVIELFPTVVRSLALGAYLMGTGTGSIVAPFLIPKNFESLYISFSAIGAMLLVSCGLTFSLPETRGKSLQETLEPKSVKSSVVANPLLENVPNQKSTNNEFQDKTAQ